MLSMFWDQQGVILTDYVQQGVTITGEYYRNLLRRLQEEIKKEQCGMLGKGARLLQDNAPAHAGHATKTLAASFGYEILPHPPYSPLLAPTNFFLFPWLKKSPCGKRFQDDKDFLNSQNETYDQGIQQRMHRWGKCVALQGAYV
jgi:hypothetical protein